jgi:hypothetical protein
MQGAIIPSEPPDEPGQAKLGEAWCLRSQTIVDQTMGVRLANKVKDGRGIDSRRCGLWGSSAGGCE